MLVKSPVQNHHIAKSTGLLPPVAYQQHMTQLATTSSKKCFLHLASRSPHPLVFLLPHQLFLLNPLLVPSYFPISQGSDLPDLSIVTGGTAQDLSPAARRYCLTLAIASCGTSCIPPRSYWLHLLEGPLNPIHAPC